jgi:hypothetical protein
MGWVVSVTPRPPLPQERPGTHCTGGWVRKISSPPVFDHRTVQPVASRYADWAIPVPGVWRRRKISDMFIGVMWASCHLVMRMHKEKLLAGSATMKFQYEHWISLAFCWLYKNEITLLHAPKRFASTFCWVCTNSKLLYDCFFVSCTFCSHHAIDCRTVIVVFWAVS